MGKVLLGETVAYGLTFFFLVSACSGQTIDHTALGLMGGNESNDVVAVLLKEAEVWAEISLPAKVNQARCYYDRLHISTQSSTDASDSLHIMNVLCELTDGWKLRQGSPCSLPRQ